MLAELLLELGNKIGLIDDEIRKAESPQTFQLTRDVPAGRLERISAADVENLLDTAADALTLNIGLPDAPALLKIENGVVSGEVKDSLAEIEALDNTLSLRFKLILNKQKLLQSSGLVSENYHSLYYIFKTNLEKLLQAPLPRLDELLFDSRYQPTLITLAESNVCYNGPLLTIIGRQGPSESAIPRSLNRNMQERVDRYHRVATHYINWAGFKFKHLTPLHFLCRPSEPDNGSLRSILADHLLHLILLYTANRSSYEQDRFQVAFHSTERTAALNLERGAASQDSDLLTRLALWPYSGQEDADRLNVFQNVLARELESDNPSNNYNAFVEQLRHLFEEIRWHHRIFVDGQINKHFEQVKEVTDYVAGVTKSVSETLDTVTKNFTDTLLATVGFIVLTLLASLVEKETEGILFKIGMWAYAVYLVIFQIGYRMGSILHSYRLLRSETNDRLAVYNRILGQKKMIPLLTPLTNRRRQFNWWFWGTVVIYLIIVGAIWGLGNYLPNYLTQQGIISPVATPTP